MRAMIWLIVKMVKMMRVAMWEVKKRRYLVGESGEDPGQLPAGEPILLDLKDLLQSFRLYITAPKKYKNDNCKIRLLTKDKMKI